MTFLPTTHFQVLKPNQDFRNDFMIVSRRDWTVDVSDSNNERWTVSPLVIERRIREGKVRVIAFPVHPTHRMEYAASTTPGETIDPPQCLGCMLKANEEQIQFECALPVREILGPDSFGGSDYPYPEATTDHPWVKRAPGPALRTTAMPIPRGADMTPLRLHLAEEDTNTVCPACVVGNNDARVRLCVTHANCDTCGNPRVIMCPTCLTESSHGHEPAKSR